VVFVVCAERCEVLTLLILKFLTGSTPPELTATIAPDTGDVGSIPPDVTARVPDAIHAGITPPEPTAMIAPDTGEMGSVPPDVTANMEPEIGVIGSVVPEVTPTRLPDTDDEPPPPKSDVIDPDSNCTGNG